MKRIVYSPKVNAFVKTDTGVLDLSPFLVRGSVTRKLDQVSSANLEFRNPGEIFTPESGPLIHPMDPIVIFMSRIKDKPVQVFTGYVDSAPYFSIKAGGDLIIEASCTLKRLLYTYYDPGLKFFHDFLRAQGWVLQGGDSVLPPGSGETVEEAQEDNDNNGQYPEPLSDGLNDASFGRMLYETLIYIGNWDPSSIYIENLPDGIIDLVEGIFYQIEESSRGDRDTIRKALEYMLENNTFYGSGSPTGESSEDAGIISPVNGNIIGLNNPDHEEFCQLVAGGTQLSLRVLAAWCDVEGGPADNPLNIGPGRTYGSIRAGAEATVSLLKEDLYKDILDSAGKPDIKQIKAIASSPWLTGSAVFTQSYYDTIYTIWKEIRIRRAP